MKEIFQKGFQDRWLRSKCVLSHPTHLPNCRGLKNLLLRNKSHWSQKIVERVFNVADYRFGKCSCNCYIRRLVEAKKRICVIKVASVGRNTRKGFRGRQSCIWRAFIAPDTSANWREIKKATSAESQIIGENGLSKEFLRLPTTDSACVSCSIRKLKFLQ